MGEQRASFTTVLLHLGLEQFDISTRALIIGVVDLRAAENADAAHRSVDLLVSDGADAIEVSNTTESVRAVDVTKALVHRVELPISVHTSSGTVADECFAAGAVMVNDPSGLADPLLLPLAAEASATVVVHPPAHGQSVDERVAWVRAVGIPAEQVLAVGSAPRGMIDLTPFSSEVASGAAVAAMMDGVRVLRTTNVKAIRRVASTVTELLGWRGVEGPLAVNSLGDNSCQ